jgi:hypothetical protein
MLVVTGKSSASHAQSKVIFAHALSGKRTRIYRIYGANPDCTDPPMGTMRVTKQPQHGVVDIVVEKGYTDYPKDDQKYPCNLILRDHTALYYQSNSDFIGPDRVEMEWFGGGGSYSNYIIRIDVR